MSRTYLDDMLEVFDRVLPYTRRPGQLSYGDCDLWVSLSEPNWHTGELNRYAVFDSGEGWPATRGFFAVWRSGDCFLQVRRDDRDLWWWPRTPSGGRYPGDRVVWQEHRLVGHARDIERALRDFLGRFRAGAPQDG